MADSNVAKSWEPKQVASLRSIHLSREPWTRVHTGTAARTEQPSRTHRPILSTGTGFPQTLAPQTGLSCRTQSAHRTVVPPLHRLCSRHATELDMGQASSQWQIHGRSPPRCGLTTGGHPACTKAQRLRYNWPGMQNDNLTARGSPSKGFPASDSPSVVRGPVTSRARPQSDITRSRRRVKLSP